MIRITLLFVVIALACSCSQNSSEAETHNGISRVVSDRPQFSGHVVISQGQDVIFDAVYGEASPGQKMTYTERWRWASVTKQIVAVAVLQAVEQGMIDLDSTLDSILSETEIETANQITVRHLLQHTSGLSNPEDIPVEEFRSRFEPRIDCSGPVKNAPGELFAYNNCDYIVLGQILEAIDAEPWFLSLQQRIFLPAEMDSMGYDNNNAGETVGGNIEPGVVAPSISLALYEASGGLVGTVYDLQKFNRALLSGILIQETTRELLWEADPSFGFAALGQWVFPASIEGCAAPITLVERRGAIVGIQVANVLVPEYDLSLIVFVNSDSFDFGTIWARDGFLYELLKASLCET